MPAVERMAKLQLPRVQHVPGKAAAAPIERITENRAAQALQMNPNLMGAARAGTAFDQGDSIRRTEHAIFGQRSPAATGFANAHLPPIGRMARDRRIHDAVAPAGNSRDKRQIHLDHLATGKLLR